MQPPSQWAEKVMSSCKEIAKTSNEDVAIRPSGSEEWRLEGRRHAHAKVPSRAVPPTDEDSRTRPSMQTKCARHKAACTSPTPVEARSSHGHQFFFVDLQDRNLHACLLHEFALEFQHPLSIFFHHFVQYFSASEIAHEVVGLLASVHGGAGAFLARREFHLRVVHELQHVFHSFCEALPRRGFQAQPLQFAQSFAEFQHPASVVSIQQMVECHGALDESLQSTALRFDGIVPHFFQHVVTPIEFSLVEQLRRVDDVGLFVVLFPFTTARHAVSEGRACHDLSPPFPPSPTHVSSRSLCANRRRPRLRLRHARPTRVVLSLNSPTPST
eukprot:scaffold360_cov374-Pavlova_lutheri.AAC.50